MTSCLVSRLERYVALADSEKRFIEEMERNERKAKSHTPLNRIGDPVGELYVLKYGWAVARSPRIDGRSQIVGIYLPGEVIGLAEIAPGHAIYDLSMQTDGTICPFPRQAMAEMFARAPRLSALFIALGSIDQLALRRRIVSLARRPARARLIDFLLTLRDRLAVADVGSGQRIHLPFSQAEIGDVVGLTSVYINKLLRRLVEEGLIEIDRPYLRILRPDLMEDEVDHEDIHSRIDKSWFPEAP